MTSGAPSWLILGGTGFIGINFINHLISTKNFSSLTVADSRVLSARNFVPDNIIQLVNDKTIEFIHSDLAQDAHIDRLFNDRAYDIVVNLMAETRVEKFSQEALFEKNVTPTKKLIQRLTDICKDPSKNSGKSPFFVEVSTAQVYEPSSKPATENSKLKPFTILAKAKLETDQMILQNTQEGLNACILRPALVYGRGDLRSLMPRLCCAAVYQKEGERMEFLWTKNLQINTVSVNDVCRAIVWASSPERLQYTQGTVLNLADRTNTTQGLLNQFIEEIFGITTGFAGTLFSQLAKIKLDKVTAESNEFHHPAWLKLCSDSKISNSPYTTYLSAELLSNNPLHIDGTAITTLVPPENRRGVPFVYEDPILTAHALYDAIKYAQDMNLWPKIELNEPK